MIKDENIFFGLVARDDDFNDTRIQDQTCLNYNALRLFHFLLYLYFLKKNK
jgi:hypothetical protein